MPEAGKAYQADKIAVQVDGRSLALTNLAKVLYPADGFTKAEVLDYYQRISPVLLPHIAGRPMTLRRFPHGVGDLSFFEKHAPAHRPDWVRTEEVVSHSSRSRSPGETISYLVIDDLPSLIWVVNLAALELHVPMWRFAGSGTGSAAGAGRHRHRPAPPALTAAEAYGSAEPDLLVFDLDPGAPATIVECCRVAEALRPALEADGLRPLPKTSGGKGLQLYAPLSGRTAEQASELALGVRAAVRARAAPAGRVADDEVGPAGQGPHRLVAEQRVQDHDRALLAARPRPAHGLDPGHLGRGRRLPRSVADLTFTAPDVLARVEAHGDLFAPCSLMPRAS